MEDFPTYSQSSRGSFSPSSGHKNWAFLGVCFCLCPPHTSGTLESTSIAMEGREIGKPIPTLLVTQLLTSLHKLLAVALFSVSSDFSFYL